MRTQQLTMLALGFCGFAAVAGCGDQQDGSPAPLGASEEATGSIGLGLQLATGASLDVAHYTITGPKGFSKSGSIDISASNGIRVTIGGLPVGKGYSITLSGKTGDDSASCAGSATFDVQARTDDRRYRVCHLSRGCPHGERPGHRRAEHLPDHRRVGCETPQKSRSAASSHYLRPRTTATRHRARSASLGRRAPEP